MRFDGEAYAKLYPRKPVAEVPESSVETFHSNASSDETEADVDVNVGEGEDNGN